jgi:hypothetical protein
MRHRPITDEQYIERLWKRTTVDANGCWVWGGTVNTKGYGEFSCRNKPTRLHRFSFAFHKGPIPEGKLICHTCDNRRCWNPEHLWAGTNKENMVDCSRKGRADEQTKTHCIHGHEFTPENTRLNPMTETVKRACKSCHRMRQRLKLGWPYELARSLPPQRGHRPSF